MRTCPDCERFPTMLEGTLGWRHFHSRRACWWFAREVYLRHLGVRLSPTRSLSLSGPELRHAGMVWEETHVPERYDLLLLQHQMRPHVGVMLAPSSFLHVPHPTAGVCRGELWRVRDEVVGVYRRRH